MTQRLPANSIQLMRNRAAEKGWRCNLAVEWREHRWRPGSRFLAGHGLPGVDTNSSLRDLYQAALQLLFLK